MVFKPETNITLGCRHLRSFMERHKNVVDAVASYNAGSPRKGPDGKLVNQSYVDSVMAKKKALDGL
jgi:soluble lytic murein transglycosylase-like protein